MATINRQIKIEDILFADGMVENCELSNCEFKMVFKDYSDSHLLFCFQGNLAVKKQEGSHLYVYEGHLKDTETGTELRLLDEDLREIINVKFNSYTIEMLTISDAIPVS